MLRTLLIITGLILVVVYGHQAFLQATNWQAVAGRPL